MRCGQKTLNWMDLSHRRNFLTKHPKKRTSKPDEPSGDAPTDDAPKDVPPKADGAESAGEIERRKKLLDKLFWIKVAMAAIGGTVATFMFEGVEGEERRWASIGFMIMVFIASCVVGKGMNIGLPPSDRKKIVTTGIGSFVFIYLFIWILTYTLVHHPDIGIGTIRPI